MMARCEKTSVIPGEPRLSAAREGDPGGSAIHVTDNSNLNVPSTVRLFGDLGPLPLATLGRG